MPKDPSKSASKPARGAVRSRRELLQREKRGLLSLAGGLIRTPAVGWGVLIWGLFVLMCASIAAWARQQPLVAVGRIPNETAVARVQFRVEDRVATANLKMRRRQSTPWVFVGSSSTIDAIGASIENLPRALAAVEKPEQIAP